jgi:hypothetical protein
MTAARGLVPKLDQSPAITFHEDYESLWRRGEQASLQDRAIARFSEKRNNASRSYSPSKDRFVNYRSGFYLASFGIECASVVNRRVDK